MRKQDRILLVYMYDNQAAQCQVQRPSVGFAKPAGLWAGRMAAPAWRCGRERRAPSSRHMGQTYGVSSLLRPLLNKPQIWCTQHSHTSHCTHPSSVSSSFFRFSSSFSAPKQVYYVRLLRRDIAVSKHALSSP